jgi:ParB-like chromosome segregation protein Spo0J
MRTSEVRLEDIQEAPFTQLISWGREYNWLKESIDRVGLICPPVVNQPEEGKLSLICGRARIEALRALGISRTPVILRSGLSERESFQIALEDNLHTRGYNETEKAGAVYYIMKILNQSRQETSMLLKLLSVPLNPRAISRYLKLHAADEHVKWMLVRGDISFNTFVMISGLDSKDAGALLGVIESLELGPNYQRELITLCEDLAAQQDCTISDILSREEFELLIRNRNLSVPDRVKHLFKDLRDMRFPTLRGIIGS